MSEVILALVGITFLAGVVVFCLMMVMAKDSRPPRVRDMKRAPLSSPMSRINEFADLCTVTSTDVAALRRGRIL